MNKGDCVLSTIEHHNTFITVVAKSVEMATLQPSLLAWTSYKSHAAWGLVTRCCYLTAHLPHFSGITHSTYAFIYFFPTSTEISNRFWELPSVSNGLKVKCRKPVALPLVSFLPPLISTATFGGSACNAEHISIRISFLRKYLLNTYMCLALNWAWTRSVVQEWIKQTKFGRWRIFLWPLSWTRHPLVVKISKHSEMF